MAILALCGRLEEQLDGRRRLWIRGQAAQVGVVTIVDADIIPVLSSLSSRPCALRKGLGINGSEMCLWVRIWHCHGICAQWRVWARCRPLREQTSSPRYRGSGRAGRHVSMIRIT